MYCVWCTLSPPVVWLNLWYFTASQQRGGGGGWGEWGTEVSISLHYLAKGGGLGSLPLVDSHWSHWDLSETNVDSRRTSTSSFLQYCLLMWLPLILLSVFCRPFWNCSLSQYYCMFVGTLFHPSTTLCELNCFHMSSCLTFRGSAAILVTLSFLSLAGVNQAESLQSPKIFLRCGGHCILHPARRPAEAGTRGCTAHQKTTWHLRVRDPPFAFL